MTSGLERLSIDRAQAEFDSEVCYLNTASMGLPPRRAWIAMQESLQQWQSGRADPVGFGHHLTAARASYASLVGVDPSLVAVGSQVSVFVGLVAANLADDARVLTARGDFTSLLFPFLAQHGRGVSTAEVPLEQLVDSITEQVDLVAVSAVQSADGRRIDLETLQRRCAETGTQVLLDTTQATGWLPIEAGRFAYTVGGGYKWLLAPRGTAFFTVQPDLMDELVPHNAGWYAGEDPWATVYGTPLRLAPDARRFDVSPAWHSWVGAAPALDLLKQVGPDALYRHATGLAARFRTGLGLPPADSAIVSIAVTNAAGPALRGADVIGASRAGRLRLSFHLSTSESDVDRALDVVAPFLLLD